MDIAMHLIGFLKQANEFLVRYHFYLVFSRDIIYFISHEFNVSVCAFAASLATSELWVSELESKLRAAN
jgi:hypothetical protein